MSFETTTDEVLEGVDLAGTTALVTGSRHPAGAPKSFGSWENDNGVFAMHTGNEPQPSSVNRARLARAASLKSTPSAPYTRRAMVSIFLSSGHSASYAGRGSAVAEATAAITCAARSKPPSPPRANTSDAAQPTPRSRQYADTKAKSSARSSGK